MKYENMSAKDILEMWRKERKIATFKELAELLGVSPNTLDTWKNRDSIPERAMLKYESIGIFSNDEALYIEYGDQKQSNNTISDNSISSIIKAPIISAKASAGVGIANYDVESVGELLIDRMMFKILPNLQNVRAVEVSGDSMYPTLKDGDYVVIEENMHFTGEGIYVLQFDGMLLVKRLQATSRGLKVLSDNVYYKDDEYVPDDDQRTFQVVGKVVLRIQR